MKPSEIFSDLNYKELPLVVVRGYPIGPYVPIIDFWPVEISDEQDCHEGYQTSVTFFDRLDDPEYLMANEKIIVLQMS